MRFVLATIILSSISGGVSHAQDRFYGDRDWGASSSAAQRAASGSATDSAPRSRRDLPRGASSATANRAARGSATQ